MNILKKSFVDNKYPLIVIGVSILIRIITILIAEPVKTLDAQSYFDVASYIKNLDFTNYDGGRTPGYPFITLLGQMNLYFIVIIQMVMGISISFFIYKIMLFLTKNDIISTITGLAYSLFIFLLHRELLIGNETTTLFFLIISCYIFVRILDNIENSSIKYYQLLLLITFSSLATLTRPMYLMLNYLFFMFFITYWIIRRFKFRKLLIVMILLLIPHLFFINGWSLINKKVTGTYALTTYAGIVLLNRVGSYIESSPKEFDDIKYIYIKYRDKELAERGSHECSIWRAFDELKDKTGLSDAMLCKKITAMCYATIKEEPVTFITGFFPEWVKFWRPAGLDDDINPIVKTISIIERLFFIFLEILFLAFPIAFVLFRAFRKALKLSAEQWSFILVGYSLILLCSIAQAIFGIGNSRYSIPTDPLLMMIVTLILTELYFNRSVLLKSKAEIL